MAHLAALLTDLPNRKYAHVTGCGTAGIYIALKSLGLYQKRIAIPNNVCYSVPLAVLLSGNVPVYLDIERRTLGLSVNALEAYRDRVYAVIAVHAYGVVCDIERISDFCINHGLPLIEDCAVAQGAHWQDKPAGSWGDVVVLSFGAGKIVGVGHGGALLTNDKSLFDEFVRIDDQLPAFSSVHREQIKALGIYHKQLYNRYYLNDQVQKCCAFKEKVEELKTAFLHRFSPPFEKIILDKIASLLANHSARTKNVQRFLGYLGEGNEYVQAYKVAEGSAIWRLNLFVKHRRNGLFKYLLHKGYKISSWHPSVDLFFQSRKKFVTNTPISDWVGDHILNIWVNDEIDDGYLKNLAHDIVEFTNERVLQ